MNKVTSKSKGCANKKCSPRQNGTQLKLSEPPEGIPSKNNVEELKVKPKCVNGLINGTTDDRKIFSNKTEIQASQDGDDDKVIKLVSKETSNTKVEEPQCSVAAKNDDVEKSETKPTKKSKSKKRNKNDNSEAKSGPSDDTHSSDFDIFSIINDKYKEVPSSLKDVAKDVASQLEGLEIGKEEKPDEPEEPPVENPTIEYVAYESELQMPLIMKIIQKDLSEPYSIYTYRYFIHNWPNLCFLAMCEELCVGAIVCKLDMHRKVIKRGYIAMLAVDKRYRKHGIGSTLVRRAIQEMIAGNADEVVLETEITNKPALRLYEALGFVRDKRLFRYYLNGVDALRLKLWLR